MLTSPRKLAVKDSIIIITIIIIIIVITIIIIIIIIIIIYMLLLLLLILLLLLQLLLSLLLQLLFLLLSLLLIVCIIYYFYLFFKFVHFTKQIMNSFSSISRDFSDHGFRNTFFTRTIVLIKHPVYPLYFISIYVVYIPS